MDRILNFDLIVVSRIPNSLQPLAKKPNLTYEKNDR